MATNVSPNAQGDYVWTETVTDADEDDVTHTQQDPVELDQVDGVVQTGADRRPDWLDWDLTVVGVNSEGEWEEQVKTFAYAPALDDGVTYTFKYEATDGLATTPHTVTLTVPSIQPVRDNFFTFRTSPDLRVARYNIDTTLVSQSPEQQGPFRTPYGAIDRENKRVFVVNSSGTNEDDWTIDIFPFDLSSRTGQISPFTANDDWVYGDLAYSKKSGYIYFAHKRRTGGGPDEWIFVSRVKPDGSNLSDPFFNDPKERGFFEIEYLHAEDGLLFMGGTDEADTPGEIVCVASINENGDFDDFAVFSRYDMGPIFYPNIAYHRVLDEVILTTASSGNGGYGVARIPYSFDDISDISGTGPEPTMIVDGGYGGSSVMVDPSTSLVYTQKGQVVDLEEIDPSNGTSTTVGQMDSDEQSLMAKLGVNSAA